MRSRSIAIGLVVFGAACSSSATKAADTTTTKSQAATTTAAPATTTIPATTTTAAPSANAAVAIATTSLGATVTDAKGRTVYLYTPDGVGTNKSTCDGGCASLWPPVPAAEPLDAGTTGLTLTAITRTDGTKQLAINGSPVYLYAGDSKAGDVAGQGVGSIWYALDAAGKKIASK